MRQKQHSTFMVLGVVLLLFMAGCKGGGDTSGGAPTTPFLGGSQGLEISFLEGSPPDEVTDGNNFPFQAFVSLKNLGEYELINDYVKVSLIGILPSDFGVDTSITPLRDREPADEYLTPRQRDSEGNIIESVETYVVFPSSITYFNFVGNLAGNTDFTFRANVCYKYQTTAVSEICALDNMIDPADNAICDPSESKSVFSSGSPIGITSFRQNVVGKDRIQFSFDIIHSGRGEVFDSATAANCPTGSTRRTNEDKIRVTVNTGLSGLSCPTLGGQGSGIVKLVNGRRTITCTQTISVEGDFEKPIDIRLDFNYLDSVNKKIVVKHLLGSVGGPFCGDPYCDSGEDVSCPQDCDGVDPFCGDTYCDPGEDVSCPQDCD